MLPERFDNIRRDSDPSVPVPVRGVPVIEVSEEL